MKKFLPLIFALLAIAPMIFAPSCANTTQAPTGGKKDTIPPRIIMIDPLPGKVNFPCEGGAIVFDFNEYVTIKSSRNIFLSPPPSKQPKARIRNRSLVVSFEEPLLPNTTYTLNLSGAIADNNEGNMFPGYTYVFSTGESIDSMYITGAVRDCNTLEPVKNATVMLYRDHSDSAVFLRRPDAATLTDDWGFFAMPFIADTLYRLYAVIDASSNNIYDPAEDRVGFVDSLILPVLTVADSVPELKKYDMTDTLGCEKRFEEYEINVFREKPSLQFLKNRNRVGERTAYVTFNAENAWIDTLWIPGYAPDRIITQFNRVNDSLEIWINDASRHAPDTLRLMVNYRKTDTLGNMVPFLEEVKLFEEGAARNHYSKRRKESEIQHKDTICNFTVDAKPERIEQYGFEIEFPLPLTHAAFDSISLCSVNPRQIEQPEQFSLEQDSLNIRRFTIRPEVRYMPGYEYILKFPYHCFRDINGFWSDSTAVKVSLPTDETLSLLLLEVRGVDCKYIVDLLDESGKTTVRSFVINEDTTLRFPYLKAAKYSIRLTKDTNGNSIVDTGDLLKHIQCEPVKFLRIGRNKYIEIPESSELTQTVDVTELFRR